MGKIEIACFDHIEILVDVSRLSKTEEMFFNATQITKPFDKTPKDFLKIAPTKEYIQEIFKEDLNPIKTLDDLITIKRGRYGGTWLHNELAFELAGWCSPLFRRLLHKWAENRLRQEHEWQQKRLESKTGFLPLTNAVLSSHDPVKHYHFKNEMNLINLIVLGMTAKEFKKKYDVTNVRDNINAAQLSQISRLQIIDTGLIEIGMDYEKRKEHLTNCHERGLALLDYKE